jgi:hypothetical protein
MKPTKTYTSLTWASGSATASGTTNTINTATDPYDVLWGQVVVVGTPTAGASIQVQESVDGSTWWSSPAKQWTAGTLAAGTYQFGPIPIDPASNLVQVVYTAQSGGSSSTLTMQLGQVTQIS